jgi:anti-sigma B factor antagonist
MTLRILAVDEHVWTIAPRGRIDQPAARAIEDALNELCDAGNAQMVVDLSEVVYVASAGLASLLTCVRRARRLKGDVRLCAMNDRVRDVFEMSGFDQVFAIYPTAERAVASYKPSGAAPAAP